jgi:signal transduction histidine kinase
MLNQNRTPIPEQLNEIGHRYLPKMTALFIEGLAPRPDEQRIHAIWSQTGIEGCMQSQEQGLNVSIIKNSKCRDQSDVNHLNAVPNENLRTFICGISNCFNNLFMGIWGYISLIKLSMETPCTVRSQVAQMERLIQNGAVLVHIIFGYLAENHTAARRLRLKQLLEEINECIVSNDESLDLETIETCMMWASNLKSPTRIARSITRVFEQLFRWISEQQADVLANVSLDDSTQSRLQTIDTLVKRGEFLLQQIKCYTGDAPIKPRRMRIKPLINRVVDQAASLNDQIDIMAEMATPLPDIHADRSQLITVLQHLIYNAFNAMPDGGQLKISARLLKMEQPDDRFVAHPGKDYIVVTISDNGFGMSHSTQARIFDPFYVGDRTSKRVGLGLAVSSGIVKSHGGFIHVRSREGQGSTFKIYLPIVPQSKPDNEQFMWTISLSGSFNNHLAVCSM